MFAKLLKYDFKSIKRIGFIIMIVALALGIFGAIDGFFIAKSFVSDELFDEDGSALLIIFTSLGMLTFIFIVYVLIACATVMQVIIYVNFYKTLCTDQGYLAFTLPVKQRDILLSKTLNAIIWGAMITFVIVLSIFLIISGIALGIPSDDTSLPPSDSLYPTDFTSVILEIGLLLLTGILYFLNNMQLIFMVIFFASIISKKNKGVTAILLVLAVNFVYSSIVSTVSSIFSVAFIGSSIAGIIIKYTIFIVLLVGTGIVYFLTTKRMMEKKLNLP